MEKITIQSAMENLDISRSQAEKLDTLDGNNKDGIEISIYTMAKLVLAHKKNDKEYIQIYADNLKKDKALDAIKLLEVEAILDSKKNEQKDDLSKYPKVDYTPIDKNTNNSGKTHFNVLNIET